jgi:signal transduction histidine kinase
LSGDLLVGFGLEATPGSTSDQEKLEDVDRLLGFALQAGFYVTTLDGEITNGIGIERSLIGTKANLPGFDDVVSGKSFQAGFGAILPVGKGVTTDQPQKASVIPVMSARSSEGGQPVGALVSETPVSPDDAFNDQIRRLQRGDSRTHLVFDAGGTVLAATDPALVAKPVPARLRDLGPGLHRDHGELVVEASPGLLGWTLVVTQDLDEFEDPVVGPLQVAGTVLVIALLGAGFVMTWVLIRRLRAARAEQLRLAQISSAQQELISIVSHELRTPVAGVLGFLETSLDHWDSMDDAQRRSAVARAAANARRLQAMARDVLDTQSLEAGHLVQALAPVDLTAEVRDAVEAVREIDGERSFEVDVPDGEIWVSADADRIQQVLANLLDNASKNAPVVAPIEVSVAVADGEAVVAVQDHGPGITGEALDRIFDKFVRGRGESVTGTGLGLYISRQIVTAHGGRIWAESDPGEGATFRFSLPLTTPAALPADSAGPDGEHPEPVG